MAGFLFALLSQSGHGLEAPEPPAGEGSPATRLHLTVRQGRLSVDLWEAEVGKVLARLAHEAGLAIRGGPYAGTRVSAQFTDVELERGLRHLMRLASLSYAIRYAEGPAGEVVLQDVRVFRAAPEEARPPPNVTEHTAEERAAEPVPPSEGEVRRQTRHSPGRAGPSRHKPRQNIVYPSGE